MLTKSQSGKIGGQKTKEKLVLIMKKRITVYNQNPNNCKGCNEPLDYEKKKNKFCSHSCSALFNNKKRGHFRSIIKPCKFCKKNTPKKRGYCSSVCAINFKKMQTNKKIESGLIHVRSTLKRYLIEKFSYNCFDCDLSEWKGLPLSLELDHIDGNAANNYPNNLRLLCPNCHSITPTWKSKNKGNGRGARGLPLY